MSCEPGHVCTCGGTGEDGCTPEERAAMQQRQLFRLAVMQAAAVEASLAPPELSPLEQPSLVAPTPPLLALPAPQPKVVIEEQEGQVYVRRTRPEPG